MKSEKTQKGNPHKLPVKQHIFPVRSIERFTGDDGMVSVHVKSNNKIFRASPINEIFTAKRIWDDRAETGYMKLIEDDFQEFSEALLNGNVKPIGSTENEDISKFFGLWYYRSRYRAQPNDDTKLQGIIGLESNFTKDEQEILEKSHIGFIRPDLKIPGRQITGMQIQLGLIDFQKRMTEAHWLIVKASKGEFIVPDAPFLAIIPIIPTLCLVAFPNKSNEIETEEIKEDEVRRINKFFIESSQRYYFARDFSKCPK